MNPHHVRRFRPGLEVLEARVIPQATRTWVSGVGDDANPCSRTAPGKTFGGAISKTAAGGEIDVLDPGGFGSVTITKSITIDGGGFTAGVLVSGTNGIVINAGANDVVVLRGLDIVGLGTGLQGILIQQAGAVFIEDCTIQQFTGNGIDLESSSNCQLFVSNTTILHNDIPGGAGGVAGILVHPTGGATAKVTIDNCRLQNNAVGLEADDNSQVTVNNTQSAGNTQEGFLAKSTTGPVRLTLQNDLMANNGGSPFRAVGPFALITVNAATFATPPESPPSTRSVNVSGGGKKRLLSIDLSGAMGPATGSVLFLQGNRFLGFGTLQNGKLSQRLKHAAHGGRLRAIYLGDVNYAMTELGVPQGKK